MAAPLLLLLLLLAVAAAEKNKHCELIGCVFLVTVSSDETHSTTPPPPPPRPQSCGIRWISVAVVAKRFDRPSRVVS